MNHSFIMTYHGLEFVLRKEDVDFSHGLGIVKAELVTDFEGSLVSEPLIGVVTIDFAPVLELVPTSYLYKFSVIDEANVVFNTYDFELYHITVKKGNIKTSLLPGFDFVYMGNRLLKLKDGVKESLFSLDIEREITGDFSHISAFSYRKELGLELAEASVFLPIGEDNFEQIVTYLNKEGKVVAPYYAVRQDFYYDASMDIKEVISIVKSQLGRQR